jgi:hypothetical protein
MRWNKVYVGSLNFGLRCAVLDLVNRTGALGVCIAISEPEPVKTLCVSAGITLCCPSGLRCSRCVEPRGPELWIPCRYTLGVFLRNNFMLSVRVMVDWCLGYDY